MAAARRLVKPVVLRYSTARRSAWFAVRSREALMVYSAVIRMANTFRRVAAGPSNSLAASLAFKRLASDPPGR